MAVQVIGLSNAVADVGPQNQLLVTESLRNRTGVYLASTAPISVLAAAQTAPTALAWLINPVASNKNVGLRRVEHNSVGTAAAAVATTVQLERISFSGVFSGSSILAAKRDSQDANPQAFLALSSAGLSIATGSVILRLFATVVITAASSVVPVTMTYEPENEYGVFVIRPGEGIAWRQPDAGVASDSRRWNFNVVWEEY